MSDRRSALLDAAITEIAVNGTRGMRIELVARRAGVSTALIYHHFGDRATLLQSALEHIGDRAEAYTGDPTGAGLERVITVLANEIQDDDAVRTNSAAWGELRDTSIFDHALRPTITALTRRWTDDVANIIGHGQQDGSIDPAVDAHAAAVRLTALVEGISTRWLTGMLTVAEARSHLAESTATMLRREAP